MQAKQRRGRSVAQLHQVSSAAGLGPRRGRLTPACLHTDCSSSEPSQAMKKGPSSLAVPSAAAEAPPSEGTRSMARIVADSSQPDLRPNKMVPNAASLSSSLSLSGSEAMAAGTFLFAANTGTAGVDEEARRAERQTAGRQGGAAAVSLLGLAGMQLTRLGPTLRGSVRPVRRARHLSSAHNTAAPAGGALPRVTVAGGARPSKSRTALGGRKGAALLSMCGGRPGSAFTPGAAYEKVSLRGARRLDELGPDAGNVRERSVARGALVRNGGAPCAGCILAHTPPMLEPSFSCKRSRQRLRLGAVPAFSSPGQTPSSSVAMPRSRAPRARRSTTTWTRRTCSLCSRPTRLITVRSTAQSGPARPRCTFLHRFPPCRDVSATSPPASAFRPRSRSPPPPPPHEPMAPLPTAQSSASLRSSTLRTPKRWTRELAASQRSCRRGATEHAASRHRITLPSLCCTPLLP